MGTTLNQDAVAAGSITVVLTTELNSLATATDSAAGSVTYDNTPTSGSSTAGYTNAIVEVNLGTWTTAPSAGSSIYLYMVASVDGTNFGDANSTAAMLVAVFPLKAVTTAQRIDPRVIDLLPCKMKFFARMDSGQTLNATGNTVTLRPYRAQAN